MNFISLGARHENQHVRDLSLHLHTKRIHQQLLENSLLSSLTTIGERQADATLGAPGGTLGSSSDAVEELPEEVVRCPVKVAPKGTPSRISSSSFVSRVYSESTPRSSSPESRHQRCWKRPQHSCEERVTYSHRGRHGARGPRNLT